MNELPGPPEELVVAGQMPTKLLHQRMQENGGCTLAATEESHGQRFIALHLLILLTILGSWFLHRDIIFP